MSKMGYSASHSLADFGNNPLASCIKGEATLKGICSLLTPYVVGLLAVGSGLLLTLLLQPLLEPTIFLLFFAAVAVSAWYGGMEAGLLATALSTLAISYFFLEPVFSLFVDNLDSIVRLCLFMLVTILINLLTSELRTAKQHLQMSLQKLQVSEAKFRRLVESNIIGVIVANMDGAMPTAVTELCRSYAELKTKGVCQPFENEYIRKDDSRIPTLLDCALLENNPEDVICFVLDLSEREQVELALCKSEERYRAFLEQSSEGIWCMELEVAISPDCPEDEQIQHYYQYGYLGDCNNVMAQMYGFSRAEEIIGVRLGDFLVASDPHNIAYLRNFIRSNYRLIDAESHEIDNQGNSKYCLNNLVGIVENGLLVRAWGTQRDITERKQVEAALRQQEDQLRLITNAVPVQISYVDGEQRYRFNNKVYEDWFGIPTSEIYGKHIREIVGESVYQSILPYIEAVLSGEQVTYETQVPDKDGTNHYVNVTYVPQFSQQGKVEGFVALITDITLYKLAEAALKQSKRAEQEREQLLEREQAARADAEAANRMKDEFLATLSHELRTPLNAILGWTQLLRNRKFDQTTTSRALETIERNTRSLAQLIEDILDVSRIIRGTLHLNIHRVKLVPLVEAAIDTVYPAAQAKEISINCKFDPELGAVVGDANGLQQVV